MKVFLLLFILAINSFALEDETEKTLNTQLGQKSWLWVQVGSLLPMDDLNGIVDNDVNFLLGMRFSYWNDFYIHFSADYSNLNSEKADFHHAVGKVGFDWEIPHTYGAELGLGLGLFFLRASEVREAVTFEDNESDYGAYFRVQTPKLILAKFDFSADVMWDVIWTLPQSSHLLRVGFNVRYQLW